MINLTITPKNSENIYALMVKKEMTLRRQKKGTLHRIGCRKKNEVRWTHSSYDGRIKLQRCIGGMMVAQVSAKDVKKEWQLLTSFVGFVDRHFRTNISNINIGYETLAA
jgi:hypothetical protein